MKIGGVLHCMCRYDGTSGNFTCRDGSHTLPFERVNDDFCDCLDGSDEPGATQQNAHKSCRC